MKKQLLKERFQELAGIKSLTEEEAFGSAGTDKRKGQVMGEIFDLIRKHTLDPEEVMEEVATEFDIPFEFGRASGVSPNDGLPKMDPDNWAFGDNINPGNTKDQDTKRKAYIKRFGDKSPGQR